MHANESKDFLKTLSPMGTISSVSDVADAVVYLTEARKVRCRTWTVVRTRAGGELYEPAAAKREEAAQGVET